MNRHQKGLVIVYTGYGKGKTTAAVGLAVRAAGYQRKVLFLQFIKQWPTGEKETLNKLEPYITFMQMGEGFIGIWGDRKDISTHKQMAEAALAFAKQKILSDEFDVVILDEINVAVHEGILSVEEVINIIKTKPENMDLVLTGRWARQEIIDLADLVTDMQEIKHPFQKGVLARRSIDF